MTAAKTAIKREQFRQAKRLHGGLLKFFFAILSVKASRLWIPTKRLRLSVYRTIFAKKYPPGVNEAEADKPLWAYRSLNALFTRGIKPEYRPIPVGTPQFLSPCDGTIQDMGRIEQGKLMTVKGVEYTLESLLPRTDTRLFEGGHYAIIFLAPIDCHRLFSPQDGFLEEAIHVPGSRLPVHPPFQRAEYPVYALNERIILRLSTRLGPCLVVMVAGWGVGNVSLPLAPEFRPRRAKVITGKTWSPAAPVHAGDWIGTFELGSTAVLITPPGSDVASLITPNEKVKYGQPLLTYPNGAAD
jgi:phosphatidylserine decarboxylase